MLVATSEDTHSYLKDSGIENYITMDEYAALYPFLVPISNRSAAETEAARKAVLSKI